MRKLIAGAVVAASVFSASGSSEIGSGRIFEQGSHQPTDHCSDKALEVLGSSVLASVSSDYDLAFQANKPTNADNDESGDPTEAEALPSLSTVIDQAPSHYEVTLPMTGLTITMRGEEGWILNPYLTDKMLFEILNYPETSEYHQLRNPMQAVQYDCLETEFFERHSLDGERVEVIMLGQKTDHEDATGADDENYIADCLVIDSVGKVGDAKCTASARTLSWHSPIQIVIAPNPRNPRGVEFSASSKLAHELFHFILKVLNINPRDAKQREFVAYTAEAVAKIILDPENLPMQLAS